MKFDVVIIGAGVVGLAVAAEVSKRYNNVLVIEKNPRIGEETSSRNSEVIHSGIYYDTDTLKARLCVEGKELMYNWCEMYNIPCYKIGKFIVANGNEEIEKLHKFKSQGEINGVLDLELISGTKVKAIYPQIKCDLAIWSPSSGIVDSHQFMLSLQSVAESNSTNIIFSTEVIAIEYNNIYKLELKDSDGDVYEVETNILINCAGLHSDKIAEMCGLNIDSLLYTMHYVKGSYYKLNGNMSNVFKHLIYPIPNSNLQGLGIHLTLDTGGGVKFGPDVETLSERNLDYEERINKADKFIKSISTYIEGIDINDLSYDYSGIRPKLKYFTGKHPDFIINEESPNGLTGLINLIGIESPGLTASLAIARMVFNYL